MSTITSVLPGRSRLLRRWSLRTGAVALLGGALAAPLVLLTAGPSLAAGSVVVSQTEGLDPAGTAITVTGTGFDVEQGIYVSVCVDNGPGELPTPCLGGVDTTGASGSSQWISSNPPPYAEGLTIPYGPGGSFEVTVFAVGSDPKTGVDCTVVVCSLVTRSDHTAPDDRSQDTRTPLSFGGPAPTSAAPTTAPPSEPAEVPTTSAAVTTPPSASAPPADTPVVDPDGDTPPPALEAASGSSGPPVAVWVAGGLVLVAVASTALIARRRTSEKGIST